MNTLLDTGFVEGQIMEKYHLGERGLLEEDVALISQEIVSNIENSFPNITSVNDLALSVLVQEYIALYQEEITRKLRVKHMEVLLNSGKEKGILWVIDGGKK